MTKYLEKEITEKKQTKIPSWGIRSDGYTQRNGAPTSWLVKLKGEKIWRRLMVFCFSNSGSLFLKIKGKRFFVKQFQLPA